MLKKSGTIKKISPSSAYTIIPTIKPHLYRLARMPKSTKIPAMITLTPRAIALITIPALGPTSFAIIIEIPSISCVIPRPIRKFHLPPANRIIELTTDNPAIQKNHLAPSLNRLSNRSFSFSLAVGVMSALKPFAEAIRPSSSFSQKSRSFLITICPVVFISKVATTFVNWSAVGVVCTITVAFQCFAENENKELSADPRSYTRQGSDSRCL